LEGTVDCLLVYVAMEEEHEPIKSQCSVHLVSKPRERERIGEKDSGWGGEGKGRKGMEETKGEGRGTVWREEGRRGMSERKEGW